MTRFLLMLGAAIVLSQAARVLVRRLGSEPTARLAGASSAVAVVVLCVLSLRAPQEQLRFREFLAAFLVAAAAAGLTTTVQRFRLRRRRPPA